MKRPGVRSLVVTLTLLLFSGVVLVQFVPRARCVLRIAPGFAPHAVDARVFHPAGAEAPADRFVEVLPEAVATVERELGVPVAPGFRVYVCATHEDFARRIGQSPETPVRGIAFPRDVWVSPLALDFHGDDTARETLIHELVHLQLGRVLGRWGQHRALPGWFQEGLADRVAGTGYRRLSRAAAIAAIRSGRRLEPDDSGARFLPRAAADYGLTWPEYHAEARMFVEYLDASGPGAAAVLVADVAQGASFRQAFAGQFGRGVDEAWAAFVTSLDG